MLKVVYRKFQTTLNNGAEDQQNIDFDFLQKDNVIMNRIFSEYESRPRPVAIIIRGVFRTDLEDLDLSDFISVWIMAEEYEKFLTPKIVKKFDLVLKWPIDMPYSIYMRLDKFQDNQLKLLVDRLLDKIPAKDLVLIPMDEEYVRPCADFRKANRIPGVTDIDRFVDKVETAMAFRTHGLPIAQALGFQVPGSPGLTQLVAKTVGFPLIVKPVHGLGCVGTARIDDEAGLDHWFAEHRDIGTPTDFVAEEYLDCTEFYVLGVQERGRWHCVVAVEFFYTVYESIRDNKPVVKTTVPWGSDKFLKLEEFSQKVCQSVAPVPDGIFSFQLMETRDGTLYPMDLNIRVTGDIFPYTVLTSTGVNMETAQITCHLGLGYHPEERMTKPVPCTQIFFFKRPGILKRQNPIPPCVASTYEANWYVKEGELLEISPFYDFNMALSLILWNEDYEQLKKDVEHLVLHYEPCVTN